VLKLKKIIRFFRAAYAVYQLGVDNIIDLERKALFDQLTGVYNRWFLEEIGEKEISFSKRYSYPLSLVMVDLDRFKQINDTYGHAAGDEALKQVAGFLKGVIRGSDLIFRYGGDEFVLLLPKTSDKEALKLVDRIKELSEAISLPTTLSYGIASYCSTDSLKEFVKRADDDMYARRNLQ